MQVCKYANMQLRNYVHLLLCLCACLHTCMYAHMQIFLYLCRQVCNYATMQVLNFASMQVCSITTLTKSKCQNMRYTNKSEAMYMSAVAAFSNIGLSKCLYITTLRHVRYTLPHQHPPRTKAPL